MLTEQQIRKMIPRILPRFEGMATKKEICDYIHDNYSLDPIDDLSKSNSRNEPKYVQRVGNIISHARKRGLDYIEFEEGFDLVKFTDEKNRVQWKFATHEELSEINLFDTPVTPLVKKKRGKKMDWDRLYEKRQELGEKGEKFVYLSEREFVQKYFPDKLKSVIWSSKVEGDGLGYDVKSICHDDPDKTLLIEVKSTTQKMETAFRMTSGELKFFQDHNNKNERLVVYRLYDRNKDTFKVKEFSQSQILMDFQPIPTEYSMKLKNI